jgi:hypothetical protein
VEAAISSNEAQKTLLENALDIVEKMPSVANGGNPFGGPVAAANAGGQVDESAFKNMWNFNLADAAFGYLVLEIDNGRIGTEMRAQGFNFSHRTGKPGVAAPAATQLGGGPGAPQFGQAPPAGRAPPFPTTQAKPQAPPATTVSPAPVIPKPTTPQPTATEKETNGSKEAEKISESPALKGEKKHSNGLFISNVENEQAARDLFPEEDQGKIVKVEKWGKFGHVVTFGTPEEAKAALDRQPIDHKKPTPQGQPRKPNVKFFEDRGSRREGNAGTW